jgi:hypothetical protein
MLNQKQIELNIDWLLSHGSLPVRYLTHKHILKNDPKSSQMDELWKEVETSNDTKLIFSKQNQDGSWFSSGPWGSITYSEKGSSSGYTYASPKYVTTAWILPFLGKMGFTIHDERVKKSCEYMLLQIVRDMKHREKIFESGNCCGACARDLLCLESVGMGFDNRIKRYWELFLKCQREDGGWLRPCHMDGTCSPYKKWTRSCPHGTHVAANALFSSSNPEHKKPLFNALNFQLWHLSQKKDENIQTWFYRGHNMVKELLMFSETGINMQARPIQVILKWLMGMYNSKEGCFHYQGKSISKYSRKKDGASPRVLKYQLYHLLEDDWLTYYLTRIVQNMLEPV